MVKLHCKNQSYLDSIDPSDVSFLIITNFIGDVLDLSQFSLLCSLKCGDHTNTTILPSVILPKNAPYLTNVFMNDIGLETLILPENAPRLETLLLHNNRIRSLSLPDVPALELLDVHNNRLENLVFRGSGGCPAIRSLVLHDNRLEDLNLPPSCSSLVSLSIQRNPALSGDFDVSLYCPILKEFSYSGCFGGGGEEEEGEEEEMGIVLVSIPPTLEKIDCSTTRSIRCRLNDALHTITIDETIVLEDWEIDELRLENEWKYGGEDYKIEGGNIILQREPEASI